MFPCVKTKPSGVDKRLSQESLECVSREDWHISISHRLIVVFTMIENDETTSHIFFWPFSKRAYSSVLCDSKIFVSVMWSLSEGRQIGYFLVLLEMGWKRRMSLRSSKL